MVVVIAAVLVLRVVLDDRQPAPPEALAEGVYTVQRVVDGDTLLLTNAARIRLIGADTPETVHPDRAVEPWGPEAGRFTRQFIAPGQVRLTFDRERQDRYGRFLAYVWVGEQMLNEELIRAGLATARLEFRYSQSMKKRFRDAQEEARAAGRGIWSGEVNLTPASQSSTVTPGHAYRRRPFGLGISRPSSVAVEIHVWMASSAFAAAS